VAEYQTHLPDKSLLQAKLHEFYELATQESDTRRLPARRSTNRRRRNARRHG
jgi:hypothetical protein